MKFDTIIIGGGLSGLVAGIDLSRKGQKCLLETIDISLCDANGTRCICVRTNRNT